MVKERLVFYQIYYDKDGDYLGQGKQIDQMYDFSIPYFNTTLSRYFENDVIARLVPTVEAELIGVCSWRLKQKRGDAFEIPYNKKGLSREKILSEDFDIAVLTPRSASHLPLFMAFQWHGASWGDAFTVFKSFLQRDLSITIPDELTVTIYENHFIAKSELYQQYVKECLKPSIAFMEIDPIFDVNAGYITRKPAAERANIIQRLGRADYPIAPFILERLFSIWIHNKGFKIINL